MAVPAYNANRSPRGQSPSYGKGSRGGVVIDNSVTYHSYNSHVSIQKKDQQHRKPVNNKKSANIHNPGKKAQFTPRPTAQSNKGFNGGSQAKILTVYHGTSNSANASDILKNGWCVNCKNGNAYGDGVYFTPDLSVAKSYASGGGVYLKCNLRLRKICDWNSQSQAQYNNWCTNNNVSPDNSAVTAWALKNGYDALQSGNILVLLYPRYANPTAFKWRGDGKIRILSIHDAATDHVKSV